MSSTNRNFAFAYAFLVILPLVGLAGILKSGRSLTAPVSLDGAWNWQVDSAQLDSLPCGKILALGLDKTLAISQSGTSFLLTFPSAPKLTGSGILDGTTLRATFTQPLGSSATSNCAGEQLSLLAKVDRQADSRLMAGTLSVTNCPTCASVGFRAQRQSPATSRGGGR